MQISLRTAGLLFAGLLALAGLIAAHCCAADFCGRSSGRFQVRRFVGCATWAQPTGTAGKSSAAKSNLRRMPRSGARRLTACALDCVRRKE